MNKDKMGRKIYEYKIEQKSHHYSTWVIKSDTKLDKQSVKDIGSHYSLFAEKGKPIKVCKGINFVYEGTEEDTEDVEEEFYGDFIDEQRKTYGEIHNDLEEEFYR